MNLYRVRMQGQSPNQDWYQWAASYCFCKSPEEAVEMARAIVLRTEKDARVQSVEWIAGEAVGSPAFLLYKGGRELRASLAEPV